ncbi:MAG: L-threonylcarbamoyladenylate synthase [Gammaproteobacteria bacterium]
MSSARFIAWRAARVVARGGVIAHPTEGVFGLACDPLCDTAIRRILAIKRREADKGLILLAHDWSAAAPYCADLDGKTLDRLGAHWPGHTTFIVPAAAHLNPLLTGGRDTLAVRVTDHPFSQLLCKTLGHPIVSTSANRGGRPAARCAQTVRRALGADLDLIVSGPLGGAPGPSEIRDALSDRVLRPGA